MDPPERKMSKAYQESCDAGENVASISGWFLKAKKAKRRLWPGQKKFERRYLTLTGYKLYYNSDDKELGGGKPPVNMNSFLWVNVPSNNPRCVDQSGNLTGFDLVSQARILSLVPEQNDKGAQALAKVLTNWKSKVQAGFLIKINKRGKFQKRWFMLYGYDLNYYEDPDDLKTKKDPVDLRNLVKIVRPSTNPHAGKYAKFEIVDGKRKASTCLDLVFKDREYTLVAIPDDRASIELFKTIGKWKGQDAMVLVAGKPVLTSDHKIVKSETDGFGIIVTVIPPMIKSPKGWYGHTRPHLRVTVLPKSKSLGQNPAEKAGIRLGDALVGVDGEGGLSTVEKLAALVSGKKEAVFRIARLPFKMNVEDEQWVKWCEDEAARRKAQEMEEMQRLAREKLKEEQQSNALRELDADPLLRRRRKNKKSRQKSAFGPQQIHAGGADVDVDSILNLSGMDVKAVLNGDAVTPEEAAAAAAPAPPLPAAAAAAAATAPDSDSDSDWGVEMDEGPKIDDTAPQFSI